MTLSERLREAAQRRGECFDSDGMPIEAAFRDLGFSESHLFGEAADELDRLTAELDEHKKSAAFCEKHKPNGGHRAMCLVCACQNLSAALSRISYLCGEPNEMECGPYDVHCDESAVVSQVERLTARVAELEKDADQVVRKTAERCREMALWPQGIDDEQAYYGRMFAEFIDREFKLDAARRTE